MHTLVLWLLVTVLCSVSGAASAGALRVSPVGFTLPPQQAAASLTLHNDGDAPMTAQVRVFRWTQDASGEHLKPTKDVAVSPPFVSLQPNSDQLVRLVRLASAPADGEAAYRVLIDQLPASDAQPGQQVVLLMRHSLPVFLQSPRSNPAAVTWRAEAGDTGFKLRAANTGGRRLRVADVTLYDGAGQKLASQGGLVGYVLAGAEQTWTLPLAVSAKSQAPSRLHLESDLGPVDVVLDSSAR
jgi:fimbrial chaperone protein